MKQFSGLLVVSPRSRILVAMLACVFALCPAPANAGNQTAPFNTTEVEVPAGLAVESVGKAGAAARSGIHPGDMVLAWSRGASGGQIASPFDLGWLEAEQAPRGAVTLTGLRGGQSQSWTMQPGRWDLEVRPQMPAPLLGLHQEALELTSQGTNRDAAARWMKLIEMAPERPAWLRVWIETRAAKELFKRNAFEDGTGFYALAEDTCSLAGAEVCRQILLQHASSEYRRGDFVTAEKCAQVAVAKARGQDSPLALSVALDALGMQRTNRGDTARGKQALDEALKIQQELAPRSLQIARTLLYLTVTEINNYDLAQAEEFAARSLAILESVAPEGDDLLNTLSWLATVANRRGDLIQYERYLRRTVAIASKRADDPAMLAGSLSSLASALIRLGDLNQAEKYYHQALDLLQPAERENKQRLIAYALNGLGRLNAQRGDWQQAEAYLLRALNTAEKMGPETSLTIEQLETLVGMYDQKSDFTQALRYCRRAREIAVHLDPGGAYLVDVDSLCGRDAWQLGLFSEADKYLSEAAALMAGTRPGTMEEGDILASLARLKSRQGKLAESKELFEKALRSVDVSYAHLGGSTETRAGYRAELTDYYSDYIDLLMQNGERDRAFEVVELSRARALLELLNSAHVDPGKNSDPSLLKELQRLHDLMSAKSEERSALLSSKATEVQLAALEKDMAALAAQAGEVEGRIRTSSPGYTALSRPQPLKIQEAQKLLDPDTLLLEYALGTERSYLFALSSNSLHTFILPGRAAIDKAARRVYSFLTARNQVVPGEVEAQRQRRLRQAQTELPAALEELGHIVLGPVSDQLGDQKLIVAADGALNYIPFAILPDLASSSSGVADAAPLVVRHEIVNLPSASVLAILRRQQANRRPASKSVAVFADPVFEKTDSRIQWSHKVMEAPGTGGHYLSADLLTRSAGDLGLSRDGRLSLARLFFARQEADAIRAVTPRDKIKVALDFQVSRSNVTSPELRDYRIVHFATHGLLNSKHPELSGLVLSLVDEHGKPQDGFLQLQDIYNLNLSADLVVLSACETGLGKEINGEGLIGLTRGFMYAGASRVVASLWNISDAATARLMADFYQAMEIEHMSPAAALRAAQIRMWKKKRWNSPYYWAAFQIQGEWR